MKKLLVLFLGLIILQSCCELTETCEEKDVVERPVVLEIIVQDENRIGIPNANLEYTYFVDDRIGRTRSATSDEQGRISLEFEIFDKVRFSGTVSHPDYGSEIIAEFDFSRDQDYRVNLSSLFSFEFKNQITEVNFGRQAVLDSFLITNRSTMQSSFTANPSSGLVSVTPMEGSLESRTSQYIRVSINREGLGLGDYLEGINIADDNQNSQTLSVKFKAVSPDELDWVDEDNDGLVDIRTIDDLYRLSLEHTLDTFKNTVGFELVRNLDFNDPSHYRSDTLESLLTDNQGWLPIGLQREQRFSFDFYGNGFSISNLFIDRTTRYSALFAYTDVEKTIKDLSLVDIDISGGENTAGLVGYNRSDISNCSVTGEISNSGNRSGLLAGFQEQGTISRCFAEGAIVTTGSSIGGLIGRVDGVSNANSWEVLNSYADVIIRAGGYAGGLIGYVDDTGSGVVNSCYASGNLRTDNGYTGGLIGYANETITNCYSTGNTVSVSRYVGGFAGYNSRATITSSFSIGEAEGSSDVGGFVGRNFGSIVTTNYWDTETSGISNSSGGTGVTTSQLQSQTSRNGIYITWSADAWDFGTSSQYPALNNLPGGLNKQRE